MATEAPKRRGEAEEPAEEAPQAVVSKSGGLLFMVGYLILSTVIIVGVVLFVVQKRRAAAPPPVVHAPVADTLKVDSLAHPDSLAHVDPQDSLKSRIEDLQGSVRQREDSLQRATAATAQLKTRLEKLQEELDTMRERDVVLSSEEVTRLSRVFGSMQPAKAAPVLARMDNSSVAAILLMIEERSAAKILAAMTPDRAAGISTLIREQAKAKARRVKEGG